MFLLFLLVCFVSLLCFYRLNSYQPFIMWSFLSSSLDIGFTTPEATVATLYQRCLP